MRVIRFIQSDGFPDFLARLSRNNRVLAPVVKPAGKRSVVFEQWREGMPVILEKTTVPPKEAVLPQCETLFVCKKSKNPDNPEDVGMTLGTVPEDASTTLPTLIFACRSCDARGFAVLDRPFLKGPFADPYYKARRARLAVITLTCSTGCNTCFCHWVGGGPSSPEGSDVLMTEIEDGFVLQAMTPAGEALLESSNLADGKDIFPKAEAARKAAWASLLPAPDLKNAQQKVAAVFKNEQFWREHAAACLSCGACTYFCPACYCFNITDEGDAFEADGARRLRSWDNCMSSLFTREASGHNSRAQKAQRLRNRVSHKFSTYPENWGKFSCNGCGRCISNCPVHLDIRDVVVNALAVEDE
ncbi:MAG: 4Fe-4S dicluster domain-containing protein [Desulfovibrio sp.]|jgi:ferredoxin|nr:4Fe-4S dicluster domain-containing protein [Desulfovibrio sp.]